jgi:phenylacetate-CoA ligase
MDAVMYNAYAWHGIAAGERQARFWGMPFDPKKRREAVLKDFLMNRIRLSAFELTDMMYAGYYRKMYTFRPGYIYGYPSLIYEFACFCRDKNYSFDMIKLKAVVVTGEKLMPDQKRVIEEVFSARVVQEYGCSEVGVIGFECPRGKMHVMSPNVIVEVVKEGRPVVDELGEIVITELNAKSYPFIRYKLGDLGVLKSTGCSCGLSWPIIEVKEGRIDDYIITPEGNKVYDAILAYTFNGYKEYIKMFKAVQRNNGDLEIKVVLTDKCDGSVLDNCRNELNDRISTGISIRFIQVKSLEKEKSGKLRYFVSEL